MDTERFSAFWEYLAADDDGVTFQKTLPRSASAATTGPLLTTSANEAAVKGRPMLAVERPLLSGSATAATNAKQMGTWQAQPTTTPKRLTAVKSGPYTRPTEDG